MSAQYHFVEKDSCKNNIIVDSAVLVEDGVVWDQGEVEMSLNYETNDITLIENNNESYLTATDGNDTQYFSVLETSNEPTLGDLNDITLYTNGGDVEISDQQDVNSLDEQPSIYAVGTSDDLYAFQVAYDEDGNMQRYRYVLRLNENGLLESVPESLELLPVDQEIELPENQVVATEVPEEEEIENEKLEENIIVKKEEYVAEYDDDLDNSSNNNEDSYEDLQVNDDDDDNDYYEENDSFEVSEETKSGILNQLAVQKVETTTYQSEESNCAFEPENFIETNPEEIPQDNIIESPNNSQIEAAEGDLGTFEQYELDSEVSSNIQEPVEEEGTQEQQLLIADHHEIEDDDDTSKSPNSIVDHNQFKDNENIEFIEELNENESDNEDFQIVDGVHVTADTDSNEEVINAMNTFIDNDVQHTIKLQENVLQSTEPKTKNSLNKISTKINNKNLMYYVIKHPEKENVGAITQHVVNNKIIKTNPRSVLKSSFAFFEQKKEKETTLAQSIKIDKRPVKNRENSQARILHNYIAKTTIIHAPIRQERLPRKQTIKPVTRADEEIIVQEVVVSSNGIIETTEDGIVKSKVPLKPTEFLQVTDSDEEYDSKREQKRKKKRKKRKSKVPEIVISDSEDGTSDVVQIDLSFESDQDTDKSGKENQKGEDEAIELTDNSSGALGDGTKRKRGRPRKRLSSSLSEAAADTSASSKKFKSSNDSESSDLSPTKTESRNIKTHWKCAPCSKVFPSQGSLKTHMQYHTFHEPNINKRETFKKPTGTVPKPNNYKCIVCHETFKNNYLLTKHTKEHNEDNKIECGICKKLFSDHLQLNNHKRSHVKEQMFNSTTLPKHSPKRKLLANKLKVPNTDSKYKCIYCTKVFTSQLLLNAHLRTHKRFTCLTCKANFMSKLSLEDHVQNSCVKQFKTPIRRLSFKSKTPVRSASSRRKSLIKSDEEKGSSSSSDKDNKKVSNFLNLNCDSCSMTFKSHTSLFNHKVLKHGLSTPVKIVKPNKTKKLLHKSGTSSVPPGTKIQNAFSKLRTP